MHGAYYASNPMKVFKSFQHFDGKTRSLNIAELLITKKKKKKLNIAESRLLGLGAQFLTFDK